MRSNVFPLKETRTVFMDSAFSDRKIPAGRPNAAVSRPGGYRSRVISRGRRFSAVSFRDDADLYPSYAVDVLGLRPKPIAPFRTVDAVRSPDFAGLTEWKRPFVIVLPALPELPDFSGTKESFLALERRFREYGEDVSVGFSSFRLGLSSGRAAYAPLVGAMALGMVSALALEHSFGGDVQAEEANIVYMERSTGAVLGEDDTRSEFDTEQLLSALAAEDPDKSEFEHRIREMVSGYPIEEMVPEIVKQDRSVAMFLVAIAKKESNWGVRVPVLEGQDCYNYWGYRGIRKMMGTGGHTCFNSRADAVATVGRRLETLINEYDLDTPEELIVWKCGSSCAGHSSYSVQKWVSDVEMYYDLLNDSAPKDE